MISKDKVWKGFRLELSREENREICHGERFEKDNYYDYDLFMNVFHKAMNKEIDFNYFIDWCILVANSLIYMSGKRGTKLSEIYDEVSDFFDGISFMDSYNKKEFLENIAMLKYYDFCIKRAKKEAKGPFLTNGIERLLAFDHSNWNYDSCVYKLIIKDYNTKEWEIRYIDDHDFEYDENVNYSFVDEDTLDDIFHRFYGENSDWSEIHNMKF